MSPLQILRIALRALLRNKLRSFLTTLGIIMGVGAVIAMVAIGEGAKARVAQSYATMGSDLLIIMPGSSTSGGARGGGGSQPTLTYDDLAAIADETSAVRLAAPVLRTSAPVIGEDQNWGTQIQGTTPDYFTLRNWPAAHGALFSDADSDGGAKVAVLGRTVADRLYPSPHDALGGTVRIRNTPYTVVGVLATKGQSPFGQDLDDTVFVPLKTFQTKVQGGLGKYLPNNGTIFVAAWSSQDTRRAEGWIRGLLRDRHRLADGVDDDFSIRNLAEVASAQAEGTQTVTTLLFAIACVALLVGGIGIMNIMLVSVTERTREIGLRMAVGAKPRQILAQFLVEALALSTAGGVIGVTLGMGTAHILAAVFGWLVLVPPTVVAIAVAFSGVVGVVFGLYPAHKASRLDPIEALRYE